MFAAHPNLAQVNRAILSVVQRARSDGVSISLAAIQSEIGWLQAWIKARPGLFDGGDIVGSWATQAANRMPDRAGLGSSDIDLMLSPKDGRSKITAGGKGTHWGEVAQLEKDFKKKFRRALHANIEQVIGGAPSVSMSTERIFAVTRGLGKRP